MMVKCEGGEGMAALPRVRPAITGGPRVRHECVHADRLADTHTRPQQLPSSPRRPTSHWLVVRGTGRGRAP